MRSERITFSWMIARHDARSARKACETYQTAFIIVMTRVQTLGSHINWKSVNVEGQ
jgi:hypothetical protein